MGTSSLASVLFCTFMGSRPLAITNMVLGLKEMQNCEEVHNNIDNKSGSLEAHVNLVCLPHSAMTTSFLAVRDVAAARPRTTLSIAIMYGAEVVSVSPYLIDVWYVLVAAEFSDMCPLWLKGCHSSWRYELQKVVIQVIPNELMDTTKSWNMWMEGKTEELADSSIMETCSTHEVLLCIHVALLCVQDNPDDRPFISSIVSILENGSVSLPAPNRPAYFMQRKIEIEQIMLMIRIVELKTVMNYDLKHALKYKDLNSTKVVTEFFSKMQVSSQLLEN
ncbi:hypothetical protein QYE76_007136 [Lolium multiflorum]|uniref:S-locus receptor kinase C-terminal domain-containing protein n=1 Tax=Lolium multiflorum TaxID=4521 RepID=A0AAD8W514_LOLMU|nr:hypothetical protein QYE76_007136 [Lolium multiflorum]